MTLTMVVTAIIIMVVLDVIFISLYYIEIKKKQDAKKKDMEKYHVTTGQIERIEERMNLKSSYPIVLYNVHYSYLDEADKKKQGEYLWKKKNIWNTGDEIRVYYDPENEKNSLTDFELAQQSKNSILFIGMIGIIQIFLIAALLYGVYLRR